MGSSKFSFEFICNNNQSVMICQIFQEILNISKCLAAVLHIGNVAFGSTNSNSAFVKDPWPVKCGKDTLLHFVVLDNGMSGWVVLCIQANEI